MSGRETIGAATIGCGSTGVGGGGCSCGGGGGAMAAMGTSWYRCAPEVIWLATLAGTATWREGVT